MANTFTTTAVINHTTVAGFNAWVTEVIGALFTSLTLTQTADTGQTTNGGSSVPATNTAGGYVIGRFNDTLQSTAPIFFKLEFGTGASSATTPQMWITVGQGSNGSGTITGTTMTRCVVLNGTAPASTTTSYVSRYCYNATAGIFWFGFKYGEGATNATLGGLVLMRDSTSAGASAGNAAILITNSISTTAITAGTGSVQIYSYTTATLVTLPTATTWAQWYFALTTTVVSSQVQVSPCVFLNPILFVSAVMAMGLITEEPLGNTTSVAIVGGTSITIISAGNPFGSNSSTSAIGGVTTVPSSGLSLNLLWQ